MTKNENQFSSDFIKQSIAFILEEDEKTVTVAVTDETSQETKDNICLEYDKAVLFKTLLKDDFDSQASKLLCVGDEKTSLQKDIGYATSESETINIVNTIFLDAEKLNASDIHIECTKDNAIVRYRIDGELCKAFEISKEQFSRVSSRIKILSNLNILEHRLPQDGRICLPSGGKILELRVSIIPVNFGESIVLRILGKNCGKLNLDALGFSKSQLSTIRKMLAIPHGLILVSGPTGSGKSTTLNAMLNEIKNPALKIISIEDPVEYVTEGVNQIQVNEAIGLSFDTILSRVLRHDPDIIMVGEIRDEQTARLCVRAALTGHLVLSTVHTNDALDCIQRLYNMGIERHMIAAVLRGAIAQRLVKKKSGGRTVISETFIIEDESRDIISSEKNKSSLEAWFKKQGMVFINEDAAKKIRRGIILKSDAQKEIQVS